MMSLGGHRKARAATNGNLPHSIMKTYDLCLSPFFRLFPLTILIVVTVGLPILIVSQGAPDFVAILLLGIFAWQWYFLLTLAYRIVLHADGAHRLWYRLRGKLPFLGNSKSVASPRRADRLATDYGGQ